MIIEFELEQLVVFVVLIIGTVWFFTRCEFKHEMKMRLDWWVRDVDRWTVRRFEACGRFNERTSKKQWYLILVGVISLVYIPVFTMNFFIPIEERASEISQIVFLTSYVGTLAWMGFLMFRKKKCKVKVDDPK